MLRIEALEPDLTTNEDIEGSVLTEFTNDEEAIAAALRGDNSGLTFLVVKYNSRLIANLHQCGLSANEAEDIAQDTFVKMCTKLTTFRGNSQFFTWLYRIAFNAALTYKRKKCPYTLGKFDIGETPWLNGEGLTEAERPDVGLIRLENQKQVLELLDQLTNDHREVLVLREIEECSYEQIAEVLGLNVGTVRSRLNRARKTLKRTAEALQKQAFAQEAYLATVFAHNVLKEDIEKLPPNYRKVLCLRIVDAFSYKQLAIEFDCSIQEAEDLFAKAGTTLLDYRDARLRSSD